MWIVTLIRPSLASGGMAKQRGHQLEEKIDYEGSASGYITELSQLQTTSLLFFFFHIQDVTIAIQEVRLPFLMLCLIKDLSFMRVLTSGDADKVCSQRCR